MRRSLILLALLCLLGTWAPAMFVPTPALASSAQVIADCNSHGRLTRGYSVSELRAALRTIPADTAEYSNCHDVIERALLARLSGLHRGAATSSAVGPGGSVGAGGGSGGSFLPTPLLVVLVLLALAGVALGVVALRKRRRG